MFGCCTFSELEGVVAGVTYMGTSTAVRGSIWLRSSC